MRVERARPHRRFAELHHGARPEDVRALSSAAIEEGRTVFPSTVVHASLSERLLVSGANQRKIGDRVTVGPWSGLPIYALTLEERATCPRSCHHWRTCYGNNMHLARRHIADDVLIDRLFREVHALHAEGPLAVRLHILGDFWSVEYARFWYGLLLIFPGLHLFGFTARLPETDPAIAAEIDRMNRDFPERCVIRWSAPAPRPGGATTLFVAPAENRAGPMLVCPAQTGRLGCCGECGACWHPMLKDKTIAFVLHGRRHAGGRRRKEAA